MDQAQLANGSSNTCNGLRIIIRHVDSSSATIGVPLDSNKMPGQYCQENMHLLVAVKRFQDLGRLRSKPLEPTIVQTCILMLASLRRAAPLVLDGKESVQEATGSCRGSVAAAMSTAKHPVAVRQPRCTESGDFKQNGPR